MLKVIFYSKTARPNAMPTHGIRSFDSQCDVMYNFSDVLFDVTY